MDCENNYFSPTDVGPVRRMLQNGGVANWQQEAMWLVQEANARGLSADALQDWTRRRINGEPLQYILGNTDFFNVTLAVGPGALIPRPETEILVEEALKTIDGLVSPRICDICTGTGAIALALAKELPNASVVASDISQDALHWARKNLESCGLKNITLRQSDVFSGVAPLAPFDLITANPPYVTAEEYENLESVVKDYEPELALVSGEDGLDLIRFIVREASKYLVPGGWMLMEIGCGQGAALREMLEDGGFRNVEILRDYAGLDRIAKGQI